MGRDGQSAMHVGVEFEREVGALFRALGADVEQNTCLAGNQIDLLLREKTPSGMPIRIAVECKAFSRPVGIDVVNAQAGLAILLRQRGLIDRTILVSKVGFTPQARDAALTHGIELLELADLQQRAHGRPAAVQAAQVELAEAASRKDREPPQRKRIFAVVPFSADFGDVYLLGIRDVAETLGHTAERADEVEHTGVILDLVHQKIRDCQVVVADTTSRNPNVCYEVGFAHGVEKPTILICRVGTELPFDFQAMNHIIYTSIVDLRERLAARLRTLLGVSSGEGKAVG